MRIKFVVLEFDCPKWAKPLAMMALPLLAMGLAGVAMGVPKTFVANETLTATDLNANFSNIEGRVAALEQASPAVTGALSALQKPVSVHYHIAANQFLPTGPFPPPYTAVNFDAKDWDTNDAVTTGGSWQFKAPIAGKYLATVLLVGQQSVTPPANTAAIIRFSINGNLFAGPALDQRFDYGLTNMDLSGSDVLELSANDVVSIEFASDSGGGETFNVGATGGAVSFTRLSD